MSIIYYDCGVLSRMTKRGILKEALINSLQVIPAWPESSFEITRDDMFTVYAMASVRPPDQFHQEFFI